MPYAVTKLNVSGTLTDYFKDGLRNKEKKLNRFEASAKRKRYKFYKKNVYF